MITNFVFILATSCCSLCFVIVSRKFFAVSKRIVFASCISCLIWNFLSHLAHLVKGKKMEKCSFYIVDFCFKMYHQFFQSYSDTPRQKAFLHPCAFVGNQKRILSWYNYIHLNWMKNSKLTNMGCREKDTTGFKMYRTKHLITDLNEKENYKFSHMPCCLLSVQ